MGELVPQAYGRYTLLRRIAVGGMAEIFLARQQGPGRFERSLVIKRILPHLVADPQFVEMFLDEAALAAQLNHPHIGQVFDFGEAEGSYFIAMELIRGPDLRTLLAVCERLRAPPPVAVSLRLITQVLAALDYAHQATDEQGAPFNLVHRDVTPQNILVTPAGTAKLVDFGIAKAATASHQTAAGMVKGKLAYLAPEQVTAKVLDGRCDQYAVGLVLYDLLTLHRGLAVNGPEGLLVAVEARVTPIATYRTDLPSGLLEILGRALAREPSNRFPACRDMAIAIDEFLVSQGIAVADRDVASYLRELEGLNGRPLSDLSAPLPPTPVGVAPVETPAPLERGLEPTDVAALGVTDPLQAPLDRQVGISTLPLPVVPNAAPVLKKPTRNRLPSQAQLQQALAAAQGQPPAPAPAGVSTFIGIGSVRPNAEAPTAQLHPSSPPRPAAGVSTFIGLVGPPPVSAPEPEIGSLPSIPVVASRAGAVTSPGRPSRAQGAAEAALGILLVGGGLMAVISQGRSPIPLAELAVLCLAGAWLLRRAVARL